MSFFYVPASKEASDLVAEIARANGCKPVLAYQDEQPGGLWCCTCRDGTHMADQQCSIINRESAKRRART